MLSEQLDPVLLVLNMLLNIRHCWLSSFLVDPPSFQLHVKIRTDILVIPFRTNDKLS